LATAKRKFDCESVGLPTHSVAWNDETVDQFWLVWLSLFLGLVVFTITWESCMKNKKRKKKALKKRAVK
jgi:hypothetical protein